MSPVRLQKKVCMLGGFAVGKTSLVQRFVHSIFSETYRSTVGVKVDKKTVELEEATIDMMLWDLYGDDEFQKLRSSVFRGMSGYLLVVDGTRRSTLEKAYELHQRVLDEAGDVPFRCLLNKHDLDQDWQINAADRDELEARAWRVVETSALSGAGVERAFSELAVAMLEGAP